MKHIRESQVREGQIRELSGLALSEWCLPGCSSTDLRRHVRNGHTGRICHSGRTGPGDHIDRIDHTDHTGHSVRNGLGRFDYPIRIGLGRTGVRTGRDLAANFCRHSGSAGLYTCREDLCIDPIHTGLFRIGLVHTGRVPSCHGHSGHNDPTVLVSGAASSA